MTEKGKDRPRSNKYAKADTDRKPTAGERSRFWVAGYPQSDGTKVKGYYRQV